MSLIPRSGVDPDEIVPAVGIDADTWEAINRLREAKLVRLGDIWEALRELGYDPPELPEGMEDVEGYIVNKGNPRSD